MYCSAIFRVSHLSLYFSLLYTQRHLRHVTCTLYSPLGRIIYSPTEVSRTARRPIQKYLETHMINNTLPSSREGMFISLFWFDGWHRNVERIIWQTTCNFLLHVRFIQSDLHFQSRIRICGHEFWWGYSPDAHILRDSISEICIKFVGELKRSKTCYVWVYELSEWWWRFVKNN